MATSPYLGQIQQFGFNFPPRSWVACDGQTLPINENQSLYSLIGTTYGGDGRTSFVLPDLRGRVAIGEGTTPGGSTRPLGSKGGAESHTLSLAELPAHTHSASVSVKVSSTNATEKTPENNYPASQASIQNYSASKTQDVNMESPITVSSNTGGNSAHENRQPYLAINWCICLVGGFPSRN